MDGSVLVDGDEIEATKIEIENKAELFDVTPIGATYRKREPGIFDWSGSLELILDDESLPYAAGLVKGAKVVIVQKLTPTVSQSGPAIIESVSTPNEVGNVVKVSISFQGNGRLVGAGEPVSGSV
jgi:hypothetical protein